MQGCSLTANELACQRGDRLLFAGVGLAMKPGQALHVTGPNGVGKSSLLRILGGLLRPFGGAVNRNGAIGLVDENSALDPTHTLENALQFWARVDGCSNLRQNCGVMGIEPLLDVPVRYLSTGQKKRAAFVRLLNQGAPIWLLDEPLNGLDEEAREKVIALARLHCGGGGICVIASHQPVAWDGLQVLDLAEYTR